MAIRSTSSTVISFGLVAVPVKVYTSNTEARKVKLNTVHAECGHPVKQQYSCPHCDVVVGRDAQAKVHVRTTGKGKAKQERAVPVTAEEIKATQAPNTENLQIGQFIDPSKVPLSYFDKLQFLAPDKGGSRAYALLVAAMEQTGLAGVAQYAARGKEHVVLVRSYGGGLVMQQVRYEHEVRTWGDIPRDESPEVTADEMAMACDILTAAESGSFDVSDYQDSGYEQLAALVAAKHAGEAYVVPERGAELAQVLDLSEALARTMEQARAAQAEPEQPTTGRRSWLFWRKSA